MAFRLFVLLVGFAITASSQDVCTSETCKNIAQTYLSYINESVNPCDNFYEYACGNFPKFHPMTNDQTRISSFSLRNGMISYEVDEAIKAEEISKSHTVQYLSEIYQECNQTDVLEKIGVQPLLDTINQIIGDWPLLRKNSSQPKINNSNGPLWLKFYIDTFSKLDITPIIRLNVQYSSESQANMLHLSPGLTGLMGNNILHPELHVEMTKAYKNYIRNVAILLGAPDDAQLIKDVEDIFHLEQEIAQEEAKQFSSFTVSETLSILNLQTRVNWTSLLNNLIKNTASTKQALSDHDKVLVTANNFFTTAARILESQPEEKLRNLWGWMIAVVLGPMTTDKFRHNEILFRETVTGVKQEPAHWQACYNFVNSRLPFAVSRVYVDKHFSAADKNEATVLINEIKGSLRKILETNTWLDQTTKKLALEKLEAVKENVGYPEWVINDADLDNYYAFLKERQIIKGKFFESALQIHSGLAKDIFDSLSRPLNHSLLWPMTPVTMNAAYYPVENSITIPAAILKSPFFDRERPIALNYGTIGVVIGHELTHGFDNNGRRFDKNGQLHNWWNSKTLQEFTKKTQCFVKQYGDILDEVTSLHVNGQQTLGENIADNGGIKESFFAYQSHETKYGKSKLLPGIKFSADQLFFLGYANTWCSVMRPEVLKELIQFNAHTPDQYRVNVPLSNSEQFSKAFSCPSGSKMNPTDKCSVW